MTQIDQKILNASTYCSIHTEIELTLGAYGNYCLNCWSEMYPPAKTETETKPLTHIQKDSMIHIPVTFELLDLARMRSQRIPQDIRNSIRSGAGRLVGCLGEVAVVTTIKGCRFVDEENKFNGDVFWYQRLIEVKTKERTVNPQWSYDASIAETSAFQNPFAYFFVSVTKDSERYTDVWIVGWIERPENFNAWRKMKKSEIVDDNHFEVRADCFNIRYSNLKTFHRQDIR